MELPTGQKLSRLAAKIIDIQDNMSAQRWREIYWSLATETPLHTKSTLVAFTPTDSLPQ